VKHGLTGKEAVIPGEDPDTYDAFRGALWAQLGPQGPLEETLVDGIAADFWRMRRVRALEAALHRRLYEERVIDRAAAVLAHDANDPLKRMTERLGTVHFSVEQQTARDDARAIAAEASARMADPLVQATYGLETGGETFAILYRHEVSLKRSVERALHELQRWQAARQGTAVTPPAVLDVDVVVRQADNQEFQP
jgi:hypothetical protein